MRHAVTLLTLLIFLAGLAKAQPTVGTTYTAGTGDNQTSYDFADFTVTTPTPNSILLVTFVVRGTGESGSSDAANTSCSVGGVTAVNFNTRGASTRVKHAHILRANFPGSGAAGDYAVVCSTTGSALDGVLVSITQVDGLAQQVPEATVDVGVSAGTSHSQNITTVTPDAFVVDSVWLQSENPGTLTPGTGQTTLAGFFIDTGVGRTLWSSYKIGPTTPGSTAMAVSWANSVSSGGGLVSAYEVEEAVEEVKPRPLVW